MDLVRALSREGDVTSVVIRVAIQVNILSLNKSLPTQDVTCVASECLIAGENDLGSSLRQATRSRRMADDISASSSSSST